MDLNYRNIRPQSPNRWLKELWNNLKCEVKFLEYLRLYLDIILERAFREKIVK